MTNRTLLSWAGLLQPIDHWLCRSVPAERLNILRLATGVYSLLLLVAVGSGLWAQAQMPAESFSPVGVCAILSTPLPVPCLIALYTLTLALGCAYVRGTKPRLVAPSFALALLFVLTYRSSWGMIFHTDNLLVIHIGLLALLPVLPVRNGGAVLNCLQLATVATYGLAAWAKVENTGWHWADGSALRHHLAYDTLRKSAMGSPVSPIGLWVLPHEKFFAPASVAALGIELLAPLALLGGKTAKLWCALAWLFHLGVLLSMAIVFPYPLSGCAFLCFFHLETSSFFRWLTSHCDSHNSLILSESYD